jgi:hypothetical protein
MGIEGMESGGEAIDAPPLSISAAQLAASIVGDDPIGATSGMTTVELATACAELDLTLDEVAAALTEKKAALTEARKRLNERMTNEGVPGIRVTTSKGRRLVHQVAIFAPKVPAANREKVLAWLKAHHPQLVAESYNDATFRAELKKWQSAQEGDFPQALVDDGTIEVFQGTEVRFRQSN